MVASSCQKHKAWRGRRNEFPEGVPRIHLRIEVFILWEVLGRCGSQLVRDPVNMVGEEEVPLPTPALSATLFVRRLVASCLARVLACLFDQSWVLNCKLPHHVVQLVPSDVRCYCFSRSHEAVDDPIDSPPNRHHQVFMMDVGYRTVFRDFIFIQPSCQMLTSYRIHFSSQVIVRRKNGSDFCRESMERPASKRHHFCCSLNSCGNHWSSFFTLPICFKWCNIVGLESLNLAANSRVIWDVSPSIIAFTSLLSTLDTALSRGSFSRLKSPDWNFSDHRRTVRSLATSSAKTSLIFRTVCDTLLPRRNLYSPIRRQHGFSTFLWFRKIALEPTLWKILKSKTSNEECKDLSSVKGKIQDREATKSAISCLTS